MSRRVRSAAWRRAAAKCRHNGLADLASAYGVFPSRLLDGAVVRAMSDADLDRISCGSTFLELSKKDFDKRCFVVPALRAQQRIAPVLNAAEEEIDEHCQSIEKLRTEMKALMQQLLTSKRRVAVDA